MPWLVGVTADRSSLRLGLATSTACPLLMAIMLLWMQRHPAVELKENRLANSEKQMPPITDSARDMTFLTRA